MTKLKCKKVFVGIRLQASENRTCYTNWQVQVTNTVKRQEQTVVNAAGMCQWHVVSLTTDTHPTLVLSVPVVPILFVLCTSVFRENVRFGHHQFSMCNRTHKQSMALPLMFPGWRFLTNSAFILFLVGSSLFSCIRAYMKRFFLYFYFIVLVRNVIRVGPVYMHNICALFSNRNKLKNKE